MHFSIKRGSNLAAFFGLCLTMVTVFCAAGAGQNPRNWQIEIVDKSQEKQSGLFNAMAIDRFGNFHLAYPNPGGTALLYAFRSKAAKRWDKTVVDPSGGTFASIAVDSRGWARLAYNSSKVTGLHYAEWDGKRWKTTLIDPVRTNHETSIQVDSQDYPHISYYREDFADRHISKSLKYAFFDGKSWFTQTADHRSGTGSWNSLAIDQNGKPRISYSISTGFLGYAYEDQSGWEHGLIDLQDIKDKKRHLDSDSSIMLGPHGEPRVLFVNATAKTLNYAWREASGWKQETIDSLTTTGGDADRVSLKLDKSGNPHVTYYDAGLGMLKYATRDKIGWHTEVVDDDHAGQFASLCLDENDEPHVSYYSTINRELRIAQRRMVTSAKDKTEAIPSLP